MAKHHDHNEHKSSSSEVSESESDFDMSKLKSITAFFSDKKKMALLATIILVLIPVVLTFYIRLQPQYLPATDGWAQNSVYTYFRNQIANSVNAQYPNLPTQNKQALIDQQFSDFQEKNGAALEQQIKSTSEFFKTGFRYEENNITYTFLGDLDSYFFLRQARNLDAKGTVCDEIIDGECWDNHMYAPLGTAFSATMHPYGIFYLYKFLRIFNPSINLMQSAFLLPTLLAAIAALGAFFVGKRLMNEVAGFFAAMFITLSPMFLSRTLGSDTDIWNVFFSLIVLWAFLESFEAKSMVKKIILASLTAVLFGLFSFAWTGWWYIFDLTLASLICYIIFNMIRNYLHHGKKILNDDIKQAMIIFAVLFVGAALFVSLFTSPQTFISSFSDPISRFVSYKLAANPTLWPNVITTVAEMNEASVQSIVSQTSFGFNILFAVALFGILVLLLKKKLGMKEYILAAASIFVFLFLISKSAFALSPFVYIIILLLPMIAAALLLLRERELDIDIKPAIILSLWFVGSILAGIKGVRFILLLAPAFAVAIGVAIGYFYRFAVNVLKQESKLGEMAIKVLIFIILAFIILMPFNNNMPYKIGVNTAKNFVPSMTRGWWDSLEKINVESKPDAIINSWWDFGHWFKYKADRAVTLDGASQNHPNAHWLGRLLQTDSEDESVGILRMLDCGSNNAFEEINKKYLDTEVSQNIMRELTLLDKEGAGEYLNNLGFTDDEMATILKFSHCDPPEDFLITSEDMVGKAGVWAHFGLWDFDKAYIINNLRTASYDKAAKAMKDRWNYTEEEASSIYYSVQALQSDRETNDWISPWPNYMTGDWVSCQEVAPVANGTNATASSAPDVQNHMLICGVGRTISEDANGRTSIDAAIFNFDDNKNSSLVIGSYDSTGFRRASGNIVPRSFVVMKNDSLERVDLDNSTFPYDVIVDLEGKRALISDPLLSESTFTKLFFMDGKYTTHFEKFSDVTDITGQRIIIWKVKW